MAQVQFRHGLIYVAGAIWSILVLTFLGLSHWQLGEIQDSVRAVYSTSAAAQTLVQAVSDDPACGLPAIDGKRIRPSDLTSNDTSCIDCRTAAEIVNHVFYSEHRDEYAYDNLTVGLLYSRIHHHVHNNSKCESYNNLQVGNAAGSALSRIGEVATENYVLEKTITGIAISLGTFAGAILLVATSEVLMRSMRFSKRRDGHLLHWLYTTLVFVSVFSYIVCFIVSFTREFWVDTYHVMGVPFGAAPNLGEDGFDPQDHVDASTYLILGFVFQLLAFAAHFTIKYGPLVNITRELETKVAQEFPNSTALASKTAAKIQYAPLVSVARRA